MLEAPPADLSGDLAVAHRTLGVGQDLGGPVSQTAAVVALGLPREVVAYLPAGPTCYPEVVMAKRPEPPPFFLPGWWKNESGLLVPSTVGPRMRRPQARVPEELLPEPRPIAIGETGVSDFEQIAIYLDEEALHIEPSSLDKLREVASQLNFEAAMLGTAQVSGKLQAFRGEREPQLRMAREIFPSPFIERIEAFFTEHENAELFAEQQVFILQRLLVENATGAVPHDLSGEEGLMIALSLIGTGSIVEATSTTAQRQARNLEDWLAFFVQNGAYNTKSAPMGEIARALEIYTRIARDPELADHDKFCPLDEWVLEDYGFTLEEQLTLGFALAAMSHAWENEWEAGTRCYIAPNIVNDLFVKLGWEAREGDALRLIAGDRATLKAEFAELGDSPEQIVWETRPLMRHPFLRCENGGLILLSPRAIQSWLTEGVHYRLLGSAQKRAEGDKKRRVSWPYTAFAGVLLERYVLDLLRSSFGERPVGGGRVYGEQPYGRRGKAMTSDVAIDLGLDLVLIEISVSRLRADTLQIGSPEAVEEDLNRMLIQKMNQLDGCNRCPHQGQRPDPGRQPGARHESHRADLAGDRDRGQHHPKRRAVELHRVRNQGPAPAGQGPAADDPRSGGPGAAGRLRRDRPRPAADPRPQNAGRLSPARAGDLGPQGPGRTEGAASPGARRARLEGGD